MNGDGSAPMGRPITCRKILFPQVKRQLFKRYSNPLLNQHFLFHYSVFYCDFLFGFKGECLRFSLLPKSWELFVGNFMRFCVFAFLTKNMTFLDKRLSFFSKKVYFYNVFLNNAHKICYT